MGSFGSWFGSPAKGGPKSECLARVKIARTSEGAAQFNNIRPAFPDPSRFPLPAFRFVPPSAFIGPVPLSAFRPAFRFYRDPSRFPLSLSAFVPLSALEKLGDWQSVTLRHGVCWLPNWRACSDTRANGCAWTEPTDEECLGKDSQKP